MTASFEPQIQHRPPGVGALARIRRWRMLTKVAGEDTGGQYAIVEHSLEPGLVTMPMHACTRETITYYGLAGVVTVATDGRACALAAGASLVVPAGVPHAVLVREGQGAGPGGEAPARFLSVIGPAGLERYFAEVAAAIPNGAGPDMDTIHASSGRFGVEVDMLSLLQLMEQFGVHLA